MVGFGLGDCWDFVVGGVVVPVTGVGSILRGFTGGDWVRCWMDRWCEIEGVSD